MKRLFRYKYVLFDARYIVWSTGTGDDWRHYGMERGFWKVRVSGKNSSMLWREPFMLFPIKDLMDRTKRTTRGLH